MRCGFYAYGDAMCDAQWVVVLGPPVLELSAEPTMNLFDEMDLIADKLRSNPLHIEADDQIKFRELHSRRRPTEGSPSPRSRIRIRTRQFQSYQQST